MLITPDRECIQTMTPHQVRLVRNSFKTIEPIATQAGRDFYNRLFEVAPELRPLFPDSMEGQHAKLINVLGTVIGNLYMISLPVTTLQEAETFMPQVRTLGRRHSAYGVKDSYFDKLGSVLIWTLRLHIGESFTDEVEEAWLTIYDLLTRVMKEGMKDGAIKQATIDRDQYKFLERFNSVAP
jgi:hemoglobin-like flavoprotein